MDMQTTSATTTASAPATTPGPFEFHSHPFTQRFARPLPTDLHRESAHMDWRDFCATYAPQDGPLRLQDWTSRHLGRGLHHFEATFHGERPARARATATGEIRATSEMLHQLGYPLEIERFHQHVGDGVHATIIHGADRLGRSTWAVGFGPNGPESAMHAMLSAVARLY